MSFIKNKVGSVCKYKGNKHKLMAWVRRLPQRPSDDEILRVFALQTERYIVWSIETGLVIW